MPAFLFLFRARGFRVHACATAELVSLSGGYLCERPSLAGSATRPGGDRLPQTGERAGLGGGHGGSPGPFGSTGASGLAPSAGWLAGPNPSAPGGDLPAVAPPVLLECRGE